MGGEPRGEVMRLALFDLGLGSGLLAVAWWLGVRLGRTGLVALELGALLGSYSLIAIALFVLPGLAQRLLAGELESRVVGMTLCLALPLLIVIAFVAVLRRRQGICTA